MQATVRTYDPATGSGTVLLDDGVELSYGADAVTHDLRHLRIGQRVRVEIEDRDGRPCVTALNIYTL